MNERPLIIYMGCLSSLCCQQSPNFDMFSKMSQYPPDEYDAKYSLVGLSPVSTLFSPESKHNVVNINFADVNDNLQREMSSSDSIDEEEVGNLLSQVNNDE